MHVVVSSRNPRLHSCVKSLPFSDNGRNFHPSCQIHVPAPLEGLFCFAVEGMGHGDCPGVEGLSLRSGCDVTDAVYWGWKGIFFVTS